ncbi:MAG: S8 family serine peptidase [Proteobacteria bacterium]|nr:S8 family serine peptidase [Pseudomonadota bacterium]
MRLLARASALAALVLSVWIGAPASADTAATTFDDGHRFVVVTFANDPVRPTSRAGSTGRRYMSGTYRVAQGAHNNAQRVADTYSLKQVASWPIKQLGVHCVVYEIPDNRPVAEVLAALTKDPKITLAQPLQQFHTLSSAPTTVYNDPLYGLQTNLVSLDIAAAHERAQGAGIKVALIDTGVDRKHPDLQDRIVTTRSFVTTRAGTTAGAYRHGTAMAGLIAAVANNKVGIVGIAPLAQIEVFEACWQLNPNADDAACNTFTLAQAIAAAIDANVPLINMSIGGPADPLLSALVQAGLKRGVIFVGSTTSEAGSFPTNISGVIGVGNSEGNHGSATLTAPATHVMTLRPGAEYDFESGTSVAAAEVTGMIALLLSANNHLTADSIVSLLKSTPASANQPLAIDVNAALAKVEGEKAGRLARSGR